MNVLFSTLIQISKPPSHSAQTNSTVCTFFNFIKMLSKGLKDDNQYPQLIELKRETFGILNEPEDRAYEKKTCWIVSKHSRHKFVADANKHTPRNSLGLIKKRRQKLKRVEIFEIHTLTLPLQHFTSPFKLFFWWNARQRNGFNYCYYVFSAAADVSLSFSPSPWSDL